MTARRGVVVKNVVRLALHNRCTELGQHFPEDDWAVVAFGDTYEEAIEVASRHPRIADLCQPRLRADVITVFIWEAPEGTLFITPVNADSDYCCRKFTIPAVPVAGHVYRAMDEIRKTRPYKSAVRRKRAAERREQKRLRAAGDRRERALYDRLHKKFVIDKPPLP